MMLKKIGPYETLKSINKKVKFDYKAYIQACEIIANDIKEKYKNNLNNIELIGIARGALPMLVTLSHMLNIRNIFIVQTKMSNSDFCHDYGEVRYLSDNLTTEKKKCIVFEDIIYKGKSTKEVISILKNKNKEILNLYSLIIDENFIDLYNNQQNINININYVYEIYADDWVYFLWEENLNKLNLEEEK